MISVELAGALILLALIIGLGGAWAAFSRDLNERDLQLEDSEADNERLREDLDDMTARALAAEQSIELVLHEGDRDPLTAPVRVIRGVR